jgi:molecular chaperone IbpA
MSQFDLTPFYRSAIGLDRMANLFDSLSESAQSQQPNWPPYNIEKEGETNYRITMAVAGFSEAELDITLHEQMLIIAGQTADTPEAECREYLYRGIASRQFERRFQLADFIQIKSAELKDGLLNINLVREIPEAMKPRKIEINQNGNLVDLKKKKRA